MMRERAFRRGYRARRSSDGVNRRGSALARSALPVLALLAGAAAAAPPKPVPIRDEPVGASMSLGDRPGDPTKEMPAGQRLISSFGERPAFSPDGAKIAFIGKSYGDAFEYDLATGAIRNLTGHMAHNGFVRVQYLGDGSYILIGPHVPGATLMETRGRLELFWMDAKSSRPAVRLGVNIVEGVATSMSSNRIAWAEVSPPPANAPKTKLPTTSSLKRGEVIVANGAARLSGVTSVATPEGCMVEAQDFLPGEKGLTFPCYKLATNRSSLTTEVMSVDFATGRITRYPTPPNLYGEIEGIFPDGRRTLVECSGDRSAGMDICMLELKTDGPSYRRLTRIMDYGRWKYGNPVVSPNGRMIASQIGSADVAEAGVGQGIVVIDLPKGF